ncbi:MAG: hypothetical protein RIR09_1053 [Pseudomonadota bacterium]
MLQIYLTLSVGTLAQLVEQRTFNPFVVGSTPARPTNIDAWYRKIPGIFIGAPSMGALLRVQVPP